MVYRSANTEAQAIADYENGVRMVKEAMGKGDPVTAWKQAQAYDLDALTIAELGLPERLRPMGFKPKKLKAMGHV